MKFEDPVWGAQEIEKDVIKKLIKSEPFQRLKDIQQAGPQKYFMEKNEITRYEHSLGVFFLLKSFDASKEEQIAGLLHDVPHTAFSHVADFVFDTEDHEYHERFMERIIYSSKIPEIIENNGYSMENILDESRFKLLERDLPDLCADRIDYFLRDKKIYTGSDIKKYRESLTVSKNEFILDDRDIAEDYALDYIWMGRNHWANPREVAILHIFSEIISRAMKIGEMEKEELFKTDRHVYNKLRNIEDPVIEQKFRLLDKGIKVEVVDSGDEADIVQSTKARFVDPKVSTDRGVVRVTDYSEKVRKEIERHREEVKDGYMLKLVG